MRPPPTNTLPIIQKLIGVYKIWHEYLPNFSKDHRYTLGFKIDSLFVGIIEDLYQAQFEKEYRKYFNINNASLKLDKLKFFLQILWEIKGIDDKKYIHLSNHLNEVGKMLGGWLKDSKTKSS